ncbi:MAG: hypothetical protein WCJ06_17565 [Planctomycetota bacterium]
MQWYEGKCQSAGKGWYEPRRIEWAGLLCCPNPDEMGFYIIAGVVEVRENCTNANA